MSDPKTIPMPRIGVSRIDHQHFGRSYVLIVNGTLLGDSSPHRKNVRAEALKLALALGIHDGRIGAKDWEDEDHE